MIPRLFFILITISIILIFQSCTNSESNELFEKLGEEEYNRLMSLSADDFDQSPDGFRKHSGDYEIASLLIPEYIKINKLSGGAARNLHWHMGQIHAFNGNSDAAIIEMKQAYAGSSKTWSSYVSGSIAFLERDKEGLLRALDTLEQQEDQMNIQILDKFVKYFDKSYSDAMNGE